MKIKNVLLIICLGCFSGSLTAQNITQQEKQNQFMGLFWFHYNIENDDKEETFSSWNFSNNPYYDVDSTWQYLTVDSFGYVTGIYLSGMNLTATFPDAAIENALSFIYMPKLEIIDISNNNFSGLFPSLVYAVNPYDPQAKVYSLPFLKKLIINNNNFDGILSIPYQCVSLKEVKASHNQFFFFSFNAVPQLEYIDVSYNRIVGLNPTNANIATFWRDTMPFELTTYDISHNYITFGNLWMSTETQPESHNFFEQPDLNMVYYPQNEISLYYTIINNTVRKVPGDSVYVKLPNVGQENPYYPEIKDSLVYRWFKDGVDLELDSTMPDLRIPQFSYNDTGVYYCEITCKKEYLSGLVLKTEDFRIIYETNEDPTLALRPGDSKFQRIVKGNTSRPIKFIVSDDMPLNHPVSVRENTFEVIKLPNHLEYLGSIHNITVKDTSLTWVGMDTLIVEYCDFEGGCVQDSLFYEVYDFLYTPPFEDVTINSDRELIVTWDSGFYLTKAEQPDGYVLTLDTCPNAMGIGGYTRTDSIPIPDKNTNTITIPIPESDTDYLLDMRLLAQQGDTLLSQYPGIRLFPIPAKADTITQHSYNSDTVTFFWEFNSCEESRNMTKYNAIYYSVNGGEFQFLENTNFNQNSYTHVIKTDSITLSYKLVKRTLFINMFPSVSIELPYLESNTITIAGKEADTLFSPPVQDITVDEERNMKITWDTDFYNDKTRVPDGYYILLDTLPEPMGTGTPIRLDSIPVQGASTRFHSFPLPDPAAEYHLMIRVFAQQGDTVSSYGGKAVNFPMPVVADSLTSVTIAEGETVITWDFKGNTDYQTYTGHNALYYSNDSSTFHFLDSIPPSRQSYSHATTDTLFYKLVKRAVSEDLPVSTELPYLASITLKAIKNDVSIPSILEESIRIYPNPVSSAVIIETGDIKIKSIKVLDSNGRVLYSKNKPAIQNGQYTVDISKFSGGVYIIRIDTSKGTLSKKVIKR